MKQLHMVIVLLAAAMLGGCIEREMTITSQPAGALVYVSDVEVGRTPLTMSFTWYGDYDIILRHEGYETLKTHANINAPVYGLPPIDLFVSIAPWTVRDQRYLHFQMDQQSQPSDEELIVQADELRKRALEDVE